MPFPVLNRCHVAYVIIAVRNRSAQGIIYRTNAAVIRIDLDHKTELGWYLCLAGGRIVGGMGVIKNDFHDRKDLTSNVCAVYTENHIAARGSRDICLISL